MKAAKWALPGIIGGSGLQQLPGLEVLERIDRETTWGKPSSPVTVGRLGGRKILFIARHSDAHGIPPHRVNYRANIAALSDLGATCILAFNAVGGISANLRAGSLVVPDQIIDYTWGREHTYSDSTAVPLQYVDFTVPYDEEVRQALVASALGRGEPVKNGGVYGATQGPRLESAAEILRMERDGCDIVGMTGMPEAGLAREKGLPYACLALVVNPAAGKTEAPITMEAIAGVMAQRIPVAAAILADACVAGMV